MTKVRVLIIDDEMEFASTLSERLELRNFESRAVESAEEAVAIMEGEWTPHVVILDLKMPGTDGLTALGMIKQRNPCIEVIMLTGHGSTVSGIEGMKRGLFDYLMKPIDIEELVTRINDALEKNNSAKLS